MVYPKELLQDGEEIVINRNPHWSFMLGPIFMITVSIFVVIALAVIQVEYIWVGGLVLLFALFGSVGTYLRWKTTEFVVTSDRVILRQGIIAKQGIEIPLDRIVNISYHQSAWERILGSGDLIMESASETGRQPFTDISEPAKVQNIIYRQIEDLQRRDAQRQADMFRHSSGALDDGVRSASLSIPEQIEKLYELYRRGVISQSEYEEKRQRLLDQI